jgi:1-acyl-sn-glycerol-3-phosphate acyltransferase
MLPAGRHVVTANHTSLIDPIVLALALPPGYTFVAADDLRIPLVSNRLLRRLHVELVARNDRSAAGRDLARMTDAIDRGVSLVVFPEGGISPTGRLRPFHAGPFLVASRLGVPVVPVGIQGTRLILPNGRLHLRPGDVRVAVGQPLPPSRPGWSGASELRLATAAAIEQLILPPGIESEVPLTK